MPARRILILYGTSYGQTAKIARRMDDLLTASGETVILVDASNQPRGLTPREFDGVIVGGSIIRGRHQKSVRRFVHVHWDVLNAMPSAFFSVSLAAVSPTPTEREEVAKLAADFPVEAGWHPHKVVCVAGRLAYTRYGFLTRFVMKRIARRRGAPTDTSRDYEFTNWDEVACLADAIVRKVAAGTAQAA